MLKPRYSVFLPVAVAAGLGLASAVPAQAGSIELGYVVEVAGTTMMKAAYRTEINGGSFESSLFGKTEGVTSMFSGYKMNLSASGRVAGNSFLPAAYENDRKKKGKKAKSTGLTWQPDGSVTVGTAQGVKPPPAAVASAIGASTSDPLTAILKMANNQSKKPCSGKFRVYDGKDVFDLSLSFSKTIALGNASGLDCKLTWTPVAGVAVDKGETDVESYGLVLAPVRVGDDIMHLPVRITGSTKGLSIVVSSSVIKVDGQAVKAGLSN